MKVKQLFDKLMYNWPAKAVCFVMALFLYVFNQQSGMVSKTIKTNLLIETQSGFSPAEAFNTNIAVSLRGKSEEISSITEKDITAYIDLSYVAKDGKYDFPVLLKINENVAAINPLEIKVTPEKISLNVEEEIAGFAEVSPLLKGDVPHGYEVKSVTISPPQVKIRGSKSLVENCRKLQTSTVVLNNATKSFSSTVKVDNPRKNLQLEDKTVYITVEVAEIRDSKLFSNVPVKILNLHPNLELKGKPKTVSFVLEGPLVDIEKIKDVSSLVRADCTEISEPGTFTAKLRYSIPYSLKISGNQEQTVALNVELKSKKENDLQETSGSSLQPETDAGNEEKIIVEETLNGSLEEKVEEGKAE